MNNELEETLDRLVSLSAELVYKAGESKQVLDYSEKLNALFSLPVCSSILQFYQSEFSQILHDIQDAIDLQDWLRLFDVTAYRLLLLFRGNECS